MNNTITRPAYYTLGVLTLVYSFNFIDRQLLAILQESIKADLGLKDAHLGLLTGFAFAAFYVTAGIPIARWADRSNRRNIVSLAVFTWSFMTSISGMAQNFVQLLLARIGVGVGEAGGSPPSHSIISDLYPPEKRGTAMGFYSTGVNIGILFGFLLGGWLNEFFGWRLAFVVVGIPGILLAILVRYTVAEPPRTASSNPQGEPLKDVLTLLWSRKSFRFMAGAAALNAFAGYAIANWTASFMIRSHGMETGELGTWLALILGVAGAVGVLSGGYLSDRFGKNDPRWYIWFPIIFLFISAPLSGFAFSVDNPYLALSLLILPGTFLNAYLGNVIAVTHGLVGQNMRATASAILFFILNIIGLGLGPWSVGILSDVLYPSLGDASLGVALTTIVPTAMILAAMGFFAAARHLRKDLLQAS
ncbi:MFS transporter [Spongiibacter sp. KMU-158]|uniref:MFS transporter n=1 Tax=Spongiibacter pelagi TaxID=2760804 RepID=A0A927C2F5_9GAMM|nr:MFS transporter [Spongiibacter pelagi]MBD2859524.1 MFS transporter [Spongiibacter pelagi]